MLRETCDSAYGRDGGEQLHGRAGRKGATRFVYREDATGGQIDDGPRLAGNPRRVGDLPTRPEPSAVDYHAVRAGGSRRRGNARSDQDRPAALAAGGMWR